MSRTRRITREQKIRSAIRRASKEQRARRLERVAPAPRLRDVVTTQAIEVQGSADIDPGSYTGAVDGIRAA